MTAPHDRLAALADTLETTMRALRAWTEPPPPLRPFRMPFAMDAMPFEHWLQLVLVPRMRAIAAAGEPLPPCSNLAAHAVREFDGRDELAPLVDVLRQIDELSPPPAAARPNGGPRLGLAAGFLVVMVAWAFVAVAIATRLAPFLTPFSHPMVVQTFDATLAPGADFRPLRITVAALADDDDAIRATDGSFVLLRSLPTMTRGPTAPLDFTMSEPPTAAAVLEWLGDYGVDARADAAHAAAHEALAVIAAAAHARTATALHAGPVAAVPRLAAEELVRIAPRTPEWVGLVLAAALVLGGAIPTLLAFLRAAGRR